MNKYEDPIQFEEKKKAGNVDIEYSDLLEISQGGPAVGNLSVNEKVLHGRYGGPAICKDYFVYAPVYVKKFFGTGFKLARINANTYEVEHLGKTKDLIFLDKIENNRVYFFEDLSKTVQRQFEL